MAASEERMRALARSQAGKMAPAAPASAALAPSAISRATESLAPAGAAPGGRAPAPAAPSPLATAKTGASPIVLDSVEATVQATQGLQMLDLYDFKLYGQGLQAGPGAVPLTSSGHEVLYQPPPPGKAEPGANAAAAAAAAAAKQHQQPAAPAGGYPRTASGTPALPMHGLPVSSSGGRATAPPQQAQRQQQPLLRQHGAAAGTGGQAAAAGAGGRQQARPAAAPRRTGGWLQRAKARSQQLLQDAAEALLLLLYSAVCWLGRMLLIPLRALFAPWYNYNREIKHRSHALLSDQQLDVRQLSDALGALPSWLAGIGGATERLDWLNTLLAQAWPVLDPVACALIRSSIEPLLETMKPPFIAAMGFQKLTLGELPLELEGLRVVGGGGHEGAAAREEGAPGGARAHVAAASAAAADMLELEVDFAWVGEPNISFFVEMALAGPATRLVPKVSHLSVRGTARIGLARLLPQLPGFGALLFSLARTPQVKFTLDFGPALGGRVTAKPVAAFLDPFLRDTLASLLVWPNRFVVPLLPKSATGNLDDLALHSMGVLEVEVLSAQHLPKKGGMLSAVDPQVELWTQPQHHVHSAVKTRTRHPNWKGQRLEVLVQEPDSQQLHVVLNDIGVLNIKELLRANLLKGAANLLRSAQPIGRTSLPLRRVCSQPFTRQTVELRLSASEWASELGVVDEEDSGRLALGLTYKPFRDLDASSTAPIACRGVLFVDVRQCQDLPSGDWDSGSSDPYVLLKVAGQQQQTAVVPHSSSPAFASHHEFFGVAVPDTLLVQVWDRDYLKPDDLLGQVELPVKRIITWSQGGRRGVRDGWWRLGKPRSRGLLGGGGGKEEEDCGRIELKVQLRPYTTT